MTKQDIEQLARSYGLTCFDNDEMAIIKAIFDYENPPEIETKMSEEILPHFLKLGETRMQELLNKLD